MSDGCCTKSFFFPAPPGRGQLAHERQPGGAGRQPPPARCLPRRHRHNAQSARLRRAHAESTATSKSMHPASCRKCPIAAGVGRELPPVTPFHQDVIDETVGARQNPPHARRGHCRRDQLDRCNPSGRIQRRNSSIPRRARSTASKPSTPAAAASGKVVHSRRPAEIGVAKGIMGAAGSRGAAADHGQDATGWLGIQRPAAGGLNHRAIRRGIGKSTPISRTSTPLRKAIRISRSGLRQVRVARREYPTRALAPAPAQLRKTIG